MKTLTPARSSARIRAHVIAVAALCAAMLVAGGPAADAQTRYETPAVLSAKSLLPPDQLAGPLFQVDDRVPTDGYLAHFTLRSSLGTFTVPGARCSRSASRSCRRSSSSTRRARPRRSSMGWEGGGPARRGGREHRL